MGSYDPYQIDRYLMKQLSLEETVAFEKEISRDVNLAKEVEVQKQLIQSLQMVAQLETQQQIKAITKNWKDFVPALSKTKSGGFETLVKKADEKIEQLTQLAFQFFIPYSVSYRKAAAETLKEKAYHLYTKKAYEAALPLLRQLPDTNIEARLMTGIALLALQKPEKAYQTFEAIIRAEPFGFLTDAHWYAGLAALCLSEIEKSTAHLQYILKDENSNKKLKAKASDLLNNKLMH